MALSREKMAGLVQVGPWHSSSSKGKDGVCWCVLFLTLIPHRQEPSRGFSPGCRLHSWGILLMDSHMVPMSQYWGGHSTAAHRNQHRGRHDHTQWVTT